MFEFVELFARQKKKIREINNKDCYNLKKKVNSLSVIFFLSLQC